LRGPHGIATSCRAGRESRPGGPTDEFMRAEIEKLVEEIKQSVGLLRRHL
jgi:hypothetical protein